MSDTRPGPDDRDAALPGADDTVATGPSPAGPDDTVAAGAAPSGADDTMLAGADASTTARGASITHIGNISLASL